MTVNPGATEKSVLSPELMAKLSQAYQDTYRGPHGDAPGADTADTGPLRQAGTEDHLVSAALLAAHVALARRRAPGQVAVAVHVGDEDFAPALQVVADHGGMQMDSVTLLLHRLGVAYTAIMNPVFGVRRDATGELEDVVPGTGDAPAETWIHIQLAESVNRAALDQAVEALPRVLTDARQVSLDSVAMGSALLSLAALLDADDSGRFSGPDRSDVADLLRWLADSHFVVLGYQRCPVSDGRASVDTSSRLGVLKFREDVLPQLTSDDDLLVLAQATIPSYLRYGTYPYIVVVRENAGAGHAVEHRFVGLFTVAAMSANVLEIPWCPSGFTRRSRWPSRIPATPGSC
ncbi:NAD-glutamate dehydrogenase [Mycolicibacterium tokaiense]|uniref:NAD-glutamate dehydrogenase n=1 Tax=Mycolicibacterium tokaiense TaxID=39695 RepID=A0A378TKJ5_9MYCO|nr:NAD-glutamate dehydrogenase [Mycolicibacterium tokaiense]